MYKRFFLFFSCLSLIFCLFFTFSKQTKANPLLAGVAKTLIPRFLIKKGGETTYRSVGAISSGTLHGIVGSLLIGSYWSNDKSEEKIVDDPKELQVEVYFDTNPEGKTSAPGEGYSKSETMQNDSKQPKPNTSYTMNYPTRPSSYIDIAKAGGGGPYKNDGKTVVYYTVSTVESCTPNPGGAWCGRVDDPPSEYDPENKTAIYKAVFSRIEPATCKAGYVPSAGECVLQLEEIVAKPSDELACELIDDGNGYYVDHLNPECFENQNDELLRIFEKKFEVEGQEVKTEVTKNADGGNTIKVTDKATGNETTVRTKKYDKSKGGAEITEVSHKAGSGSGTNPGDGGTGSNPGDGSGGNGTDPGSGDGDGEGDGFDCGVSGKEACKVDVDDSGFDDGWDPDADIKQIEDAEIAGFQNYVETNFSFLNNYGINLDKFFDNIKIVPDRNCRPLEMSILGRPLSVDLCTKLEPLRLILGYAIWVILSIGLFHLFMKTVSLNRNVGD